MTYTPVYSDMGRIQNRISQIDINMTPQILVYQEYIDSKIDSVIRSCIGRTDANGFRLLLPLTGDYDVIDIATMNITLAKTSDVTMAADDCVIAKFFTDTAENRQKSEDAEKTLLDVIYTKFGSPVSPDIDYSTDYLAANKLLWPNGTPIQLPDGSGVLLWKY